MTRHLHFWAAIVVLFGLFDIPAAEADSPPKREVTWPGMTRAGAVLLPNGWSLKPAGQQTVLGDLPVVLAENPVEPILAVLHAGYGEHEVMTLDARTHRVIGRVVLRRMRPSLFWRRPVKPPRSTFS